MRIAQVKVVPEKGNLAANFDRLMGVLGGIGPHRPDVVVTPECFLDGYVATEDHVTAESLAQYAIDPRVSDYANAAAAWAKDHGSWFVLGCSRLGDDGVYNSALVYDRRGGLVGIYDKLHCQTHDRKFVAGRSLPVFESDFGMFGIMICADRRWPETARSLALKGAGIIFNPTYGMHGERNLNMMRTRSYENEAFIAFTHPCQALVTGPTGEIVIDETCENEEFAVCEVNLADVDRIRRSADSHLKWRRPDVYEL